jgi:hypothetical protein
MIRKSGQLDLQPMSTDTGRILIARAARNKRLVRYVEPEFALFAGLAHIERVFACQPLRLESHIPHNDSAAHFSPIAIKKKTCCDG